MKALCTFFSILMLAITFPASGQNIHFVNASVTGGGQDGTTWADAFPTLNEGLAAAGYGDQVWVAAGTYFPTASSDRLATFNLPNGVKLYGGFDGTEASLGQRDWLANPTTLSGDIGVAGDSTDNSHTILRIQQADTTTLVDGLIFRHGQADGTIGDEKHPSKNGGAIYIYPGFLTAYPVIRNCHFENNFATIDGGAVYSATSSTSPSSTSATAAQFRNCVFTNNTCGQHGAAVFRRGGSDFDPKDDFFQCTFQQGFAGFDGGGVYFRDSEKSDTIEFTECRFFDNTAEHQGGGISVWGGRTDGSKIMVKDCEFSNNWAVEAEGGDFHYVPPSVNNLGFVEINGCYFEYSPPENEVCIYLDVINLSPTVMASFKLINCTFSENQSELLVFASAYMLDSILVENCRFEGNQVSGPALRFDGTKLCRVSNNIFLENGPVVESDPGSAGLLAIAASEKVVCTNNVFFDNLLGYDNLFRGGLFDTISNCLIYSRLDTSSNNLSVNLGDLSIFNSIIVEDPGFSTLESLGATNIFLENSLITTPDCPVLPELPFATPPAIFCGANMLFGLDPLLSDPAEGDFTLSPCSPARNAGDNGIVNLLGLLTDLSGQPRTMEGQVDLGPFEMLPFGAITSDFADIVCAGDSTGGFALELQSACLPATLDFMGGTTVADTSFFVFENLPTGNYPLTVTDAQGRADSLTVAISEPPPLMVQPIPSVVDCATGQTGNTTATYSGGTGKVGYAWSTGATSAWLLDLPVGEYAITVTDALGCTVVDTFEVEAVGQLFLFGEAENPTCPGDVDGSTFVQPDDGTAPYTYLWENGSTEPGLADLPSGSYAVTVTDAIGCSGEETIEVVGPAPITVDATVTPASSASTADGAIELTAVAGGTPGYSFLWSNGEVSQSINGLLPGDYALTVTDSEGCEQVFDFSVGGQLAEGQVLEVTVFPSPVAAGGHWWLRPDFSLPQMLEVQLFNVLGRQVFYEKIVLSGTAVAVPAPELAGAYFLVLRNGAGERKVAGVLVE